MPNREELMRDVETTEALVRYDASDTPLRRSTIAMANLCVFARQVLNPPKDVAKAMFRLRTKWVSEVTESTPTAELPVTYVADCESIANYFLTLTGDAT